MIQRGRFTGIRLTTLVTICCAVAVLGTGCSDDPVKPPAQQPPDTTTPPPTPPPSGLSLSLEWASYIGGPNVEEAREPIILPGGRVLFSARVLSTNLPTTAGALQPQFGGGESDTYLAIVSADGTKLEAATYFGGSGMERLAYGMAVTSGGDIVFTSGTSSRDLPTTAGAYLTQNNSPVNAGYVCRVSPTLTAIRWCTYIEGWPRGGLALTPADEVIVVGRVIDGAPFVATPGAYQTAERGVDDAFVMKLSADGSRTVFRTYLGGNNSEIGEVAKSAVYVAGDILVTGISQSPDFPTTANAFQTVSPGNRDFFLVRLSSDGTALKYSTLLGGSNYDAASHPAAVMADGSVLVAGLTNSQNVPQATGAYSGGFDLLAARFAPSSGTFAWIGYVGGNADDSALGLATDAAGHVVLVGESNSDDFPISANALQPRRGGGRDGVIVVLDGSGKILYSTFFGGSGDDWIRHAALAPDGTLVVVGATSSTNLPGTAGTFQPALGGSEDGFVARFKLGASAN